MIWSNLTAILLSALITGIAVNLISWLLRDRITDILHSALKQQRTKRVEHGVEGVMALVSLYQERVVERLTRPQAMGSLGAFLLPRMYVPLELELRLPEVDASKTETLLDLLRTETRIVVLGPPGSGKTTLLRYLELSAARGDALHLPSLPLYIPLCQLPESDTLVDFSLRLMRERDSVFLEKDEFVRLLEGGLVLLLLDGLDEVWHKTRSYSELLTAIEQLAEQYPATAVILSCRTGSWSGSLNGFREAHITPLRIQQIRRFIFRRSRSEDTGKIEKLYDTIRGSPSLLELARTPLFLSLMVSLYEKEPRLPKGRLHLYERCTELLFGRWDAIRGIERSGKIPVGFKRLFLKRLGLKLHREHQIAIGEARLKHLASEWLRPAWRDGEIDDIISELVIAHGLLVSTSVGTYSFPHVAFQEYFASLDLKGQPGLVDFLGSKLDDPWWREVIVLSAALGHSNEIVSKILRSLEDNPEASVSRYRLQIAAECVKNSSMVNPRLRHAVTRRLQVALKRAEGDAKYELAVALAATAGKDAESLVIGSLSSEADPHERVSAALALAEVGRAGPLVIDTLVQSLHGDVDTVRAKAASALGEIGTISVLNPLLSRLSEEDSPEARLEMLRAINSIVQAPMLDASELALTVRSLQDARNDRNAEVANLAAEILGRVTSEVGIQDRVA